MTNELGTTLQDIEAKAIQKEKCIRLLKSFEIMRPDWKDHLSIIRKYIEEN